ncbi:FAD-dependent thymidylate synthase [Sorangium sp. So ce296]|uniref:FAD-dependent thymidylate synthase n=1 Tax=Sorangium sp. So ce296 TaxID=3133296 RepID=UPI003F63B184
MIDADSPINRVSVPAIDSILGQRLAVLDEGFVRVVDYMGGDEAIVQAARVSYGQGTKKIHEDRGLIRYLLRHRHTTPFEMCEIKLHVRVPMDCWRQWVRHRTANINEYSTRYSIAIDAAQRTAPDGWRRQSGTNRQGSAEVLAEAVGATLSAAEHDLQQRARRTYEERLEAGVAREQARKDLPLSTYTEAYWKIDLHNLLHFLALRMDAHAQVEIRAYAEVIGDQIVKRWCPLAWEAFIDYRLSALTLTRSEIAIVEALTVSPARAHEVAIAEGFLSDHPSGARRSRELNELEQKLDRLGLLAAWTHVRGA